MAKQANKAPKAPRAGFDTMIAKVRDTVRADGMVTGKWKETGAEVKAYYIKRDNLEADKARFITAGILPELSQAHQDAYALTLPHASGKVYKSLSATEQAAIEAQKKAKKAANDTALMMFKRVADYAFPADKAPGKPRNGKSKLQAAHDALVRFRDLIRDVEKAPFDIPEAVKWAEGKIAAMAASLPKKAATKATK